MQPLFNQVHRAAAVAAVAAFALVQGMAPLLHTHVTPSVTDGAIGIHLPVAVVHAGHAHASMTLSMDVALEESSAITAPAEHRRNDAGAGNPPAATSAGPAPAAVRVQAPRPPEPGRGAAIGGLHLRPPSQAPPASV